MVAVGADGARTFDTGPFATTSLDATGRLGPGDRKDLLRLTTERVLLLRRTAYLQRTKTAFALWHVFHLPLVYAMLVIVVAHVGLAIYLGYVPFRW